MSAQIIKVSSLNDGRPARYERKLSSLQRAREWIEDLAGFVVRTPRSWRMWRCATNYERWLADPLRRSVTIAEMAKQRRHG